jgi:hypothetical protein
MAPTLQFAASDGETFPRLTSVDVPDTPVIRRALAHARSHFEPYLYHHVVRSWLFAIKLGELRGEPYDEEIVAVASLLHDLGLTNGVSGTNRFEVEGANAARAFAKEQGLNARRIQLIWDSIALHTTTSIGSHKEPEVAITGAGIGLDYGGFGYELISSDDMEQILKRYPRLQMKVQMKECFCQLAHAKPKTSYDNFLRDFGERCVPGYEVKLNLVDALMNNPFEE